jgi:hypothetical protein
MGVRPSSLAGESWPREGERRSAYCPHCARHTVHDAVFQDVRATNPPIPYFVGWRCRQCDTLHNGYVETAVIASSRPS